jgi:DNA-binding transcriptional LysR family regulator
MFKLDEKVVEVKPQGSWHSKSGQSLIAAAREGIGVVRTANFYAKKALSCGEVVELLTDWTREKTAVWIVYPSGRHLPQRVTCAIHFLLDDFRDHQSL